ncbi:hypothetical protein QTP86_020886, partial [Hemibagrus guttatus]
GKVYALGGMGSDTSPQALVRVYEPVKDQWLSLASMPTPRYGAFSFLRGNKLYVLGGRQGKMPVTAFEAFDLETKSWTRYPCIPSRRAFSSCAATERVWLKPTRSSRMREKRADFVAGCLGGRVIVAGGLGNQPSPLASAESYNHVKRRWEAVAPMPTPRCSCTPIQTTNMLFLIGGVSQGPSNAVEALCLQESV